MFVLTQLILLAVHAIFRTSCTNENSKEIVKYQYEVEEWLDQVDRDLREFNSLTAHIMWKLSTTPDEKTEQQARQLGQVRNRWKNRVCDSTIRKHWLTEEQKRKLHLLCMGPRFTEELTDLHLTVMGKMSNAYNLPICLPSDSLSTLEETTTENKNSTICVHGEPHLERLMKRRDLSSAQLRWIWITWHNHVGPKIKDLFRASVFYQNLAAQSNGYHDMGEAWREELDIKNLENPVENLYDEIKPLYQMLHAVVRHKLLIEYGPVEVDPKGPIPIHLLGNMWGQDWSPLINLFVPHTEILNLDERLNKKSWSVKNMISQAEDYYVSLGMPKMTPKFWEYSIFEESTNTSMCHGTAANMFSKEDYRMLTCAKVSMEDFYVIHHEMGHIEYYMAYENEPTIFQEGINSAFQESIGDAIMNGVLTPQHLQRLGLISDEELADPVSELYILFKQALAKIPEIAFALVVDKYRWDIFRGAIKYEDYNKKYWKLSGEIRGVIPPEDRGEEFFDAGAKFHIPDNTPYIRYFLSSILHMEIFKTMCDISVYGEYAKQSQENNFLPLHRCDIYGSKRSGKHLMSIMEKGSSISWNEALKMLNGRDYLSTKPLLEYYQPVYEWLEKYIKMYDVYVGW